MNNHSNEENTDNSSDKKSPAFKVLESNAEKFCKRALNPIAIF